MSNRVRMVKGGLATLLVVGGGVGLYVTQGPEHTAGTLQVDDTAEVLHEPTLREEIGRIQFYEPTDVAVFSHRGGTEALTNNRALNDAVLAHAREDRREWLSENEQKWADDLFIFAVDPEGRLVGTYFGENRAVDRDTQLGIQDAAKDDFRDGRWTEGAVAGVEAGADRMNSPVIRRPAGMVTAGVAGVATAAGSGIYLATGLRRARRSRELRAEGDRHLASVVAEMDVTELHARLIPEESTYGGAMLRRFEDYQKGFRELTELGNQARAIPERDYDSRESLGTLTRYRDRARKLDHLDDVIADTAAFLNLDRVWRESWARQVDPVRSDLKEVEPLLSSQLSHDLRGLPEAAALRTFASEALAALDRLRGDLEEQRVTPDHALDVLRTTRDELTTHLDALAAAVATAAGRTGSEREQMRKSMRHQRHRVDEHTILATAHPTWTWYAVSRFRSGYDQGRQAVESSREAASSSSGGSTAGYSSGGSFSGSGSSSRF